MPIGIGKFNTFMDARGIIPMLDDVRFVVACTQHIPTSANDWILEQYSGAWLAAMGEPGDDGYSASCQNAGRRAANSWLLGILKRKRLPIPTSDQLKMIRVA